VAPDHRNGRLGSLLAARAVRLAVERGAAAVYTVTETAEHFFARLGFEAIGARDALPEVILETPMVAGTCSSSSAAFRWSPTRQATSPRAIPGSG
jgi:N-acetylglutamate synthase-like GNAT family acetyltransferase